MKEVILTKIERKDEVSKRTGNTYQRVHIWTDKGGETKISGFGDGYTDTWKEGDTVILHIEQVGTFWNFRVPTDKKVIDKTMEKQPSPLDLIDARLKEVEFAVGAIKQILKDQNKTEVEKVFDEMEKKQPFQKPTI